MLNFLGDCLSNEVVPTFVKEKIPKCARKSELFSAAHRNALTTEMSTRTNEATQQFREMNAALECLPTETRKLTKVYAFHYSKGCLFDTF